jgi:hypothetical protein
MADDLLYAVDFVKLFYFFDRSSLEGVERRERLIGKAACCAAKPWVEQEI